MGLAGHSVTAAHVFGVDEEAVRLCLVRNYMNFAKVNCAFCDKRFIRPTGRFNEAKKFGWNQFCSKICQTNSKFTGRKLTCSNSNCGRTFYRELSQIHKVKKSFCSNSCAAKTNNKLRLLKYPTNRCRLPKCGTVIPRGRQYCSRLHSAISRRIPDEIHKKQIIMQIQAFYKTHNRIPVKREMYGIYRTTRSLFGSWNKVIEVAGYSPNPVMFASRYVAKDGHWCDSLAEKVIDDWFYDKNIKHERNIKYPGNPKLTADFRTKRHWIEFFGLTGEIKEYDILIKRKRKLAKKYKLPFIAIYPKDLFPTNNLEKILRL